MEKNLIPQYSHVPQELQNTIESSLKNTFISELNTDAWSLGILKEVSIKDRVQVDLVLPSFGLSSEKNIAFSIKKALLSHIDDPSIIDINFYSDVKPIAKQSIKIPNISDVRNIILVASGKGGVGKSTVASNLAVALASLGARVGLLDDDVYGPSIPIMFDLKEDGLIKGFIKEDTKETFMIPPIKYGVSLMSIGFLVEKHAPMVWRGPMIAQASMQMFFNVYWGQLDYLIVDLPPGTGDIQLSIAQKINVAGAIIVSTPQDVALEDVVRAKNMFDKVNIPILGLIENMSYFVCDSCTKRHEIFSNGGAKNEAQRLDISLMGEIPLIPDLRRACDLGKPLAFEEGKNLVKDEFINIAHKLVAKIITLGQKMEPNDNVLHNKIKPPKDNEDKKRRLSVL